jgi:Putative zinc binding domain
VTALTDPQQLAAGPVSRVGCRLCGSVRLRSFLDLGATPPCESFLGADQLDAPEPTYPLHARVCERCLLVQVPPMISPEQTFREYAYFSSYSTSWVAHAERFVAEAVHRLDLGPESFVVEVASNDGYLLQHWPPSSAAYPPAPSSSAPRSAPGSGPSAGRPTWWWPTTSTRMCPTWSASPRGCARWSPTTAG